MSPLLLFCEINLFWGGGLRNKVFLHAGRKVALGKPEAPLFTHGMRRNSIGAVKVLLNISDVKWWSPMSGDIHRAASGAVPGKPVCKE